MPRRLSNMIPEYFQTDRLLSQIRDHFPELKWEKHRLIWTGADSYGGDHAILLLDDDLIFRFPSPELLDMFRKELTITEELRPAINTYVPHYTYVPVDRTFGGCKPIPGIRLTPARFRRLGAIHRMEMASEFASLLNTVHSYPLARARELDVEILESDFNDRNPAEQLRSGFEKIRRYLEPSAQRLIDEIIEWLSGQRIVHGNPVFTRGDIWHKHIFFDPALKRLSGVIDWAPCIADPALDFFGLWAYGEDFVDLVLSSYKYRYPGIKEHSRNVFYAGLLGCFIYSVLGTLSKTVGRLSKELLKDWARQGVPRCYQ